VSARLRSLTVFELRRDRLQLAEPSTHDIEIEGAAGGRERGAPPGAEASAVTNAFRRAPGGTVRGQDPHIACFRIDSYGVAITCIFAHGWSLQMTVYSPGLSNVCP